MILDSLRVALTLAALAALGVSTASADDAAPVALSIQNHKFSPEQPTAPAGKPLEIQLTNADAMLKTLDTREAQLQADIQVQKVKTFTLNEEMDQVSDLIDLFGPKGFRAICFEGLIERISDRAGELFAIMTDNVYTTRIEQMGETAKGEERLVLKPVISKGGLEVPLDDLSGGARRTVMLAYDVAVSEAVGESSVLFLDEALDGLDAIGKAEAMKLLEEVSRTRAVLVVDHTSEIKASCHSVLSVTYQAGKSTLTGQSEVEREEVASAVGGI